MYSYIGKERKHSRFNRRPSYPLKRKVSIKEDCEITCEKIEAELDRRKIRDETLYSEMVISGAVFNEIYKDIKIVKLTTESCIHRNFEYIEGLNIDYKSFGARTKYGLHFCNVDDIYDWVGSYNEPLKYIWDVSIPSDARVVICGNKFKADKINLSNKRLIIKHVYFKIMIMISDNIDVKTIINYIKNLPNEFIPRGHMDTIWMTIIKLQPEIVKEIPDEDKTYSVCLYAAQNYDDAYDYIIEFCEGMYSIVMECVKKNPSVYTKLDEVYKTKKISLLAYKADKKLYDYIPDRYKTLEMSIAYLKSSEHYAFNVPQEHINNIELIKRVIPNNGIFLYSVPYKLKTKELCMEAVKNNGEALNHVPLPLIDYDMCLLAITNTSEAYYAIPDLYRDTKLNEYYVDKYMYVITYIESEEVTHNMLMSILKDPYLDCYINEIDYTNKNIRNLIINNFEEYVNINRDIVSYLPFDLMYENQDNLLYAISIDKTIFSDNYDKTDLNFKVKAVISGFDFCYLPANKVTMIILDKLVTGRMSVIYELPMRFVHHGLYKISMAEHGMKLYDIPEEYRTEDILQLAQELYPEEINFNNILDNNELNDIEMVEMNNNVYECDNNTEDVNLIERVI
jgi:hypothetical protein